MTSDNAQSEAMRLDIACLVRERDEARQAERDAILAGKRVLQQLAAAEALLREVCSRCEIILSDGRVVHEPKHIPYDLYRRAKEATSD